MREESGQKGLTEVWRPHLGELVVMVVAIAVTLFGFLHFTGWVETRSGVVLDDPLLNVLPAIDLSWPIFAIIYGGLLAGGIVLLRRPTALLHFLRAYTLLVLVRIVAMYVTPLDPPAGMILLVDPLAGAGPGGALTRDLFFSGHTATMVLLLLSMRRPPERLILALATITLAAMLLLQHVHYTIDILAAVVFAWTCFSVTSRRTELHAG